MAHHMSARQLQHLHMKNPGSRTASLSFLCMYGIAMSDDDDGNTMMHGWRT